MEAYPWYRVVSADASCLQGDILRSCPVVVPATASQFDAEGISAEVLEYDVVILSQSCDLVQRKVDIVLVSPVWELGVMGERSQYLRSRDGREALRRGALPGYHLLNACDIQGFEFPHLVVDFHNVYGVPVDFLFAHARDSGERVRLLPPYREHLAQAFARFFMRVGLPVDISPLR